MVYDLANHVAYVYTNKQESKLKVLILAADIPIQESIEFPGNSPGKSQVSLRSYSRTEASAALNSAE